MSKLTAPRPLAEVFKSAITSPLAKQGDKIIEAIDDVHRDRGLAVLPSNLLGLVEKYFGKKLAQMDGGERAFAESIAIRFDQNSINNFTENYLGARIAGQPSAAFIREYNGRLMKELESEIQVMRDWLAHAWACAGAPGNIEECSPMQELNRLFDLAKVAAVTGDGGEHGVRSIMSRVR